MTVEKVKRSQSMWNVSLLRQFSVSSQPKPPRSQSVIYQSALNLSEIPDSPKGIVGRFRKRSKDRSIQGMRYSTGPCLSGDVDAVDSNGRSLLFYSARYGQIDVAKQLIETGCSPNQKDILGNTPLHEALDKAHLDIAEIFLKDGGADVNMPGFNGETPLMAAVTRGQLEAVKLLDRYGANVNICDATGHSPLYTALQRGWPEIVDFLLDRRCDVNKTTANGMTCFFAAAHCDKIDVIHIAKRLLKTDYDFKKDADWMVTEGCPLSAEDDLRHHEKVLMRAGLLATKKRKSILTNGRRKLVKTFQRLSSKDR